MVVGFASALAAPHLDPRFRGNDRTGAVRLRRTGGLGLRVRNSLESLFDKEGLRGFGGISGLTHPPCHDGAAGCRREFEGVPQFSFYSIPQEWGIQGVEEIVIASHSPERARRRHGNLFVLLATPPWDCFGSVASRNDTLVLERRAG